jgi:hypothetical protein
MVEPGATLPRLHALDSLRGLMMWLGIVLHVAANHLTGPALIRCKPSPAGSCAQCPGHQPQPSPP